MSSTQRTQSVNIVVQQEGRQLQDRNSTQLLEKILLSSSSTSSHQKIQTQSTHHQHHLTNQMMHTSNDNGSVGNHGGQYTYRGVVFNNTGKNWRKLITPAHDSFKKMQHMQGPESSGQYLGGSHVTTQLDRHIGATNSNSNNTSMETYSSVKEFNPATFDHLRDRQGRSVDDGASSYEEIKKESQISNLHCVPGKNNNQNTDDFGTSSLQMKSLMKSFSNGNFQFYENLHKKYFDKAKDKSSNLEKSENLSKTGTILGLSQLKHSIDSLKTSSRMVEEGAMRVSSLNKSQMNVSDNQRQNTMSINFKNSLYKKINTTSVFLDDNSQSQINLVKTKTNKYFDTTSSSESSDFNLDEVKSQRREARGKSHNIYRRDDDIDKYHSVLSRRDLSANQDDSPFQGRTPREFNHEDQRNNKFERPSNSHNGIPRSSRNSNTQDESKILKQTESDQRLLDSQASQNGLLLGLRSLISTDQQKNSFTNPDFMNHQIFRKRLNPPDIIFEMPAREEAMGDTYKKDLKNGGDLRAEDLSAMIDQACMSQLSSQMISSTHSSDVLKTFQEYCKIARIKQVIDGNANAQTNQKNKSNQNSAYGAGPTHATPIMINSDKQSITRNNNLQSAAPANNRQSNVLAISGARGGMNVQTTHAKPKVNNVISNEQQQLVMPTDQKSDFTFVLSNPTEFNFECNCNNTDSFITQKHARLLQNSTNNNNDQRHLRNRLHEIVASPIYSESGHIPGGQQYIPSCQNCGGCKTTNVKDGYLKERSGVQRQSYNNHLTHQSIKEEDQDVEDDNVHPPVFNNAVFEYEQNNSYAAAQNGRRYGEPRTDQTSRVNSVSGGNISNRANQQMNESESSNSLEEEIKFLRLLLQVSYEYMTKMLQEVSLSPDIKDELSKVLNLISNVNTAPHGQLLSQHFNNQPESRKTSQHNVEDQNNQNMTECDGNMTMSELRILNRRASEDMDDQKDLEGRQSELVVVEDLNNNPTGRQRRRNQVKSSLISDNCSSIRQEEDTFYSYLDEDNDEPTKHRQQSYHAGEMRKSLRLTKHSLVKTKKLLQVERQVNRQQEDQLKLMKAEIEALGQRWQMTEERMRSGENMYNILSRTTTTNNHHLIGFSNNHISTGNIINPTTPQPVSGGINFLGGAMRTSYLNNRDTSNKSHSPVQISQITKHIQSHNNLVATNLMGRSSSMAPQQFDNSQTTNNKTLIDINERLTRQIEDNINLFDNLNQQLADKDAALVFGEAQISDKEKELRRVKNQLKNMDDNMKQLIQVTKVTSDATETSKLRHLEEMDKIKRRQEEYQKKINRIQNVFDSGHQISLTSAEDITTAAKSSQDYKLKYGSSDNLKGNSQDLSQRTSHMIQDDELSLGQIQNIHSGQRSDKNVDLKPVRLNHSDQENIHPNIMAFSEVKYSPFLKDKVRNDESYEDEDSSALLKYSQDITGSQLLNTHFNKFQK